MKLEIFALLAVLMVISGLTMMIIFIAEEMKEPILLSIGLILIAIGGLIANQLRKCPYDGEYYD